jgi:hypothetical protein
MSTAEQRLKAANYRNDPRRRELARMKSARWRATHPTHAAEYHAAHREKRNAESRAYRAADPQRMRHLTLRWKYGVDAQTFARLFAAQKGRCAICDATLADDRGTNVDHDHACCRSKPTCGKCVRGLLCFSCNRGLGFFRDSTALLSAAIAYLKRSAKSAA